MNQVEINDSVFYEDENGEIYTLDQSGQDLGYLWYAKNKEEVQSEK